MSVDIAICPLGHEGGDRFAPGQEQVLCSNIPFSKVHLFSFCSHMLRELFQKKGDVFDNHRWKKMVPGVFLVMLFLIIFI